MKITDIKLNPDNPRSISNVDLEKLKNSISEFSKMMNLRPLVIDGDNMVLGGNQRLKALKKLGYEQIPDEWVKRASDLTEDEKKRFIIADNVSNGGWNYDLLENWDKEKLEEWGLELGDWANAKETEETEEIEGIGEVELPDTDYYFYSLSGGEDSVLAFLHTIDELERQEKEIEVLMVDTGVEFANVRAFAERIVKSKGYQLTIIKPEKDFYDYYINKNKWPDVIYKNCIDQLISIPIDKYVYNKIGDKEFVLVRGGRDDQQIDKNNKKDKTIQKVKRNSLLNIWNPLYNMEKGKYEELIEKTPIWEGYEKGFVRTACWCCPFQYNKQWDTMKVYAPLEFNCMKKLADTLDRDIYGDKQEQFWKKFDKYWKQQNYV